VTVNLLGKILSSILNYKTISYVRNTDYKLNFGDNIRFGLSEHLHQNQYCATLNPFYVCNYCDFLLLF
jgi:hypothetical protein